MAETKVWQQMPRMAAESTRLWAGYRGDPVNVGVLGLGPGQSLTPETLSLPRSDN